MATAELKKGDVKISGLPMRANAKIEWAAQQMPVLESIRKRFAKEQPLNKGCAVSACLHVTQRDREPDDCFAGRRRGHRALRVESAFNAGLKWRPR